MIKLGGGDEVQVRNEVVIGVASPKRVTTSFPLKGLWVLFLRLYGFMPCFFLNFGQRFTKFSVTVI